MVKVIPLGGLGEIGLNMMVIEGDRDILIVDTGLMFPDDYMPGVDFVIPDFQYLRENREKLRALILTHGHEDHIGAVPFFLKEFSVPVLGSSLTLELVKEKLREHRLLDKAELREIRAGERTEIGPFTTEFISVQHSIVDGLALAVDTPDGLLIHSGDFKIDPTAGDKDQQTDLVRFAHFGAKGVLALFSDSTNAEKEGFTPSEAEVGKTLEHIFSSCTGRIIVSTFASNVSRIQQLVHLSSRFQRRVVFNGKSMITNVRIAKQEGFLSVPEGLEISDRQIDQFPDQELSVITTGSQGEPMSVLARIAHGKHRNIRVRPGDTIIFSSRFIPGNERAITKIINSLYRMGAQVIYEKISDIHTSGHARREELKLMMALVRPRYFIPIHGEYRHLVNHAQLAARMGIPRDRILVAENGDILRFESGEAKAGGCVTAGRVLVDGKGVGDVGELVLRDRRRLSGHGLVMVLLAVDESTGETVYGPDIISRGFALEDKGRSILEDAKTVVVEFLQQLDRPYAAGWNELEYDIQKHLKRFFHNRIDRSPLVLPIIIPL